MVNNSTSINKTNNHLSPKESINSDGQLFYLSSKESLNSDGQLFYQYQQNKQSTLI